MKIEDFKLKHRMTVSQVRHSKKILSALLNLFEQAKNNTSEQMLDEISAKIMKELNDRTEEQDELMMSSLADCLDLTEHPLENIEYMEMVDLFSQLYTKSTNVEKKQPLQSTTSS